MLSRKAANTLLVVYAVILALCMIGWGVLAGLSREGVMATVTHRYVMLALVTVTLATVAAVLHLATVRSLGVHMQREQGDGGYADGYADGLAASAARGRVAQMPSRGFTRS